MQIDQSPVEQRTGKTIGDLLSEIVQKYPTLIPKFLMFIFGLLLVIFGIAVFVSAQYFLDGDQSIIGQAIDSSKSSKNDKPEKKEDIVIQQNNHPSSPPIIVQVPPQVASSLPPIIIQNGFPKDNNQPPASYRTTNPNNSSIQNNQEYYSDYQEPKYSATDTASEPVSYQPPLIPPQSNITAESALDAFYNDTRDLQNTHRTWSMFKDIENVSITKNDFIDWWRQVQGARRISSILKNEYNKDYCTVGYIIETMSQEDNVAKENCFEMTRDYQQGASDYGYWIFKKKLSCDDYFSQTYAIQLIATSDFKKAKEYKITYSSYDPYITKSNGLYRVRIGLYLDKNKAESDRQARPDLMVAEVVKH